MVWVFLFLWKSCCASIRPNSVHFGKKCCLEHFYIIWCAVRIIALIWARELWRDLCINLKNTLFQVFFKLFFRGRFILMFPKQVSGWYHRDGTKRSVVLVIENFICIRNVNFFRYLLNVRLKIIYYNVT